MNRPNPARLTLLGVLIGGCLLSLLLFERMREAELQLMRDRLEHEAERVQQTVEGGFSQISNILVGIRGLFLASEYVSRDEFAVFTQQLLVDHPFIQALEWVPSVPASERQAFERLMAVDYPGYRIYAPNGFFAGSDQLPRSHFFPVAYSEPLEGNESALGLDLGSYPSRRHTLEISSQSASATLSEPLRLVQAPDQGWGMLLVLPVLRLPASFSEYDPELRLKGFVLGVFRIDRLMPWLLEQTNFPHELLHAELLATVSNGEAEPLQSLYSTVSLAPHSRVLAPRSAVLNLFGQQWRLSIQANETFEVRHRSREPLLVLVAGILLSLLAVFALRQLLLQGAQVRSLVARRTHELGTSEARVRAILDTAVDAIISIDEQGRIQLFNPGAEKLFGYAVDEVRGQNVSMLMPPPHRAAHDGYLARYLAGGQAHIIGTGREVEGRHKSGALIPVHLSVGVAQVEGETLFVAVLKDMTGERERRDALTRAKELAEKIHQQQTAFVNTISHELRTPLTVILGYLPLLKNREQPLQPEVVAQIAVEMDQSGQHLLSLINDILDLSKIEADRMVLYPELLNLTDQVVAVFGRFAQQSRERNVNMDAHCGDIVVEADPKRLLQILTNLIGNALKFTEHGRIEVIAERQQDSVMLRISDSGIGIPPELLEQIFEPFYQVDSTRTRRVGGTGLGLTITRQLVLIHHGRIWVESVLGQGTTFYIVLPLRQPPVTITETAQEDY